MYCKTIHVHEYKKGACFSGMNISYNDALEILVI